MVKILVIDDEEEIRDVLQQVLQRAGFEVCVADCGDTGIDMLRVRPVEVVIVDIIMPGKSGVQITKEIGKEFPNTKILAISGGGNIGPLSYNPTGIATTAYLNSALEAGAHAILTKPFNSQDVIEAVRDLAAV